MSPFPSAADHHFHQLNNVFAKILGTAELALKRSVSAELRADLEMIIALSEEGGDLIAAARGD